MILLRNKDLTRRIRSQVWPRKGVDASESQAHSWMTPGPWTGFCAVWVSHRKIHCRCKNEIN